MNRITMWIFLCAIFNIHFLNAAEITSTVNNKSAIILFYDTFAIFKDGNLIKLIGYDGEHLTIMADSEAGLGGKRYGLNYDTFLEINNKKYSLADLEQKEKKNKSYYKKLEPNTNFPEFIAKLKKSYGKQDKFKNLYEFFLAGRQKISVENMGIIIKQFDDRYCLSRILHLCLKDDPTYARNMINLLGALESHVQKSKIFNMIIYVD